MGNKFGSELSSCQCKEGNRIHKWLVREGMRGWEQREGEWSASLSYHELTAESLNNNNKKILP